jgi:hypothetical protein
MPYPAKLAAVALAICLMNVPFGWWRARLRKFSPSWFLAIHAPIPFAVALRYVAGLGFRWATLPLFVGAYFLGQFAGARLGRRTA